MKMLKKIVVVAAFSGCMFFSATGFSADQDQVTDLDESLKVEMTILADKIIEAFSEGDREAYLSLLHESCPPPIEQKLESDLSMKWIPEGVQIRLNPVEKNFDLDQLSFKVEPVAAIEIQVWTVQPDGSKIELVTGYPLGYEGEALRLLDYPCFQPKGI